MQNTGTTQFHTEHRKCFSCRTQAMLFSYLTQEMHFVRNTGNAFSHITHEMVFVQNTGNAFSDITQEMLFGQNTGNDFFVHNTSAGNAFRAKHSNAFQVVQNTSNGFRTVLKQYFVPYRTHEMVFVEYTGCAFCT